MWPEVDERIAMGRLGCLAVGIGEPNAIDRKADRAELLIPLFAAYHGTSPQVLIGMSVGGTLFTLLRLLTDDVSLGLGYHWAWNVMQSAVFGPTDGLPSIRPVYINGPHRWVGRPGHAEPGRVAILVTLATTMLAAVVWGLRKHKKA